MAERSPQSSEVSGGLGRLAGTRARRCHGITSGALDIIVGGPLVALMDYMVLQDNV